MIKIDRIGTPTTGKFGRRFLRIGKYNLTVRLNFLWYDCWIGAYWDKENRYLYVCPLPMVCFKFILRRTLTDTELMGVLSSELDETLRIEALSNTELVKEVFESTKGLADSPLVVGLIDRVLPGWEDMQL